MNIAQIERSLEELLNVTRIYFSTCAERQLDPFFFTFFQSRFGSMSRQGWVKMMNGGLPQRIDYRYGGNNPVVLELAVRSHAGGGQLYGSQNISELRKLCRFDKSAARLRVLALVDFAPRPIQRERLVATYARLNAGPGNFVRESVRVVYAHKNLSYNFLWRPRRT